MKVSGKKHNSYNLNDPFYQGKSNAVLEEKTSKHFTIMRSDNDMKWVLSRHKNADYYWLLTYQACKTCLICFLFCNVTFF